MGLLLWIKTIFPGGLINKRGSILWAEYPGRPATDKKVYVLSPFLEVESPRLHGTSLVSDVAIVNERSVRIVRASSSEGSIFVLTFKNGSFSQSQIPASEASKVLDTARKLVEASSRRTIYDIPSST